MSQPAIDIIRKRYERKFTPEVLTAIQARRIVLSSAAMFKPLFHPRLINNIYLDTVRFNCYYDNVHGSSQRKKIRIRWYGDLLQNHSKTVLEIKVKSCHLGDKKLYPLPECNISEIIYSHTSLQSFFDSAQLPEAIRQMLKSYHPRLLNRYKREYFIDASGNYRMTIDEDIRFQKLKENSNAIIKPRVIDKRPVVELKYDEIYDNNASCITENIPFRLTKNSKYVNGIEAFYHVIY